MQGFPHPGSESQPPLRLLALQHYSKDKGAICTKLVKPKRKQGAKSAEEELAKGRGLRPPHPRPPGEAGPWGPGTRPAPQRLSMGPSLALQVEGLGRPRGGRRLPPTPTVRALTCSPRLPSSAPTP